MQEQRNETQEQDRFSEAQRERAVLELMLDDCYPWTVDEIVSEISGERIDAADALARLEGSGLVHRLGEFVFPTRAARRADAIGQA
jgi:predicted transcriptional regulator